MAIIKCKMCGGELNIVKDISTAECAYCGSAGQPDCVSIAVENLKASLRKNALFVIIPRTIKAGFYTKQTLLFSISMLYYGMSL